MNKLNYKYKFSVIMPIYNDYEYLKDSIESVISQDIGINNIQLLLINDASIDNSIDICNYYKGDYDSILFIDHSHHHGEIFVKNEGIEKSLGKYILFLNPTDLLEKNFLKRLYFYLEKNNDLEIILFNNKIMYKNNKRIDKRINRIFSGESVLNINDNPNVVGLINNYCFKNNYNNTIMFNKCFLPNYDHILNLLSINNKVGFCKDSYYIKRIISSKEIFSQEEYNKYIDYFYGTINDNKYNEYLFIYDLVNRLKKDSLFPDESKKNLTLLKKVLKRVDTNTIIDSTNINMFYKLLLLRIKKCDIDIKVKNKKVLVYIDSVLKYTFNSFKCVIDELSFNNKKLSFKFYLLSPIFNFTDTRIIVKYKDEEKKINIRSEDYFSNNLLNESKIYYFEGNTFFEYNNELEMYVEINHERFRLIPTFKDRNSKYIYDDNYLYQIVKVFLKK